MKLLEINTRFDGSQTLLREDGTEDPNCLIKCEEGPEGRQWAWTNIDETLMYGVFYHPKVAHEVISAWLMAREEKDEPAR